MRMIYALLLTAVSSAALFGQTTTTAPTDPARYRLQPNDVIELVYRYAPEFNQTVTILPDGFISLPLIGVVSVRGLTLDEANAVILDRAAVHLRNPEVSLLLKDYDKAHFVVTGEVKNPGRFDLRGRTTMIEAVAIAGGLNSASAKHSQVILLRRINNEQAETRVINLKETMKAPASPENVTLVPGDMLIVPQNKLSKVERIVKWGSFGIYATPLQ